MTTESGRPSAEEWRSVDGGLLSERAHIVIKSGKLYAVPLVRVFNK